MRRRSRNRTAPPVIQRNIGAVVLWMAGALLSFSTTAIAVRELSKTLSVFEILTLRSAAGVAILLALAALNPALRKSLRPRRMRLHLARNTVHFAATYAWTFGVTVLPLATVFALEFTAPAWVGLLAVALLGEAMTRSRLVSIVLGFLGVMVILRPGLGTLQPGAVVVLAAALGFALTTVATKKLTRTESTFAILFWMNAMQLPLNLAGAGGTVRLPVDAAQMLPLAGVCLAGLASHFCLTNAYRHGDAIMVVPLDFLRIPLIAVAGWWLYGEALDPFVLFGSLLIIAGILWNLTDEAGLRPRPARVRA